jgi:hypothetical protein
MRCSQRIAHSAARTRTQYGHRYTRRTTPYVAASPAAQYTFVLHYGGLLTERAHRSAEAPQLTRRAVTEGVKVSGGNKLQVGQSGRKWDRAFSTHGEHITWPQPLKNELKPVLVSVFMHAAHWYLRTPVIQHTLATLAGLVPHIATNSSVLALG